MATPITPIEIQTERLILRRQRVADAGVQRQMWTERDSRVPSHRRIGPDGRPTTEDIANWIRGGRRSPTTGLLTITRKLEGDVIGYCGLIFDGRGPSDEPELAYELLRHTHGFGYATEAAQAVLDWAEEAGYTRVWAGVRDWNVRSLRVLQKLGFIDTEQDELDAEHGDSVVTVKTFPRRVYDRAAPEYARRLPDLRVEAPIDRAMLATFVEYVGTGGHVLDGGCGPGRLIAELESAGATVTGMDLSGEMVRLALARHLGRDFAVGELGRLPFAAGVFDGVLAWYSLIHTPPARIPAALAEMARVLRPTGHLLLGFQAGQGLRYIRDAYGSGAALSAYLFEVDEIAGLAEGAGLNIVATARREPVAERHAQGFVLARKD